MNSFPVSEIFGPTIQGEGVHIGRRTYFIRFAGCDTYCDWCDTKYAWSIKDAKQMDEQAIISRITPALAPIVTLTGGNPALQNLDNLVELLFLKFHEVHVETQGTIWKDWLYQTSFVSVSPKRHHLKLRVLERIVDAMPERCQVKVVLFSAEDREFLQDMAKRYPHVPIIAQIGWPVKGKLSWIADFVANHADFGVNVRVLPQLHRMFWGDEKGV